MSHMVLTTGRVAIALAAFGVLYLLQTRSRKVTDDFLRKLDQRKDRAGNLELERQRAKEYEQFELKNEKTQHAADAGRAEAEPNIRADGTGTESAADAGGTASEPDIQAGAAETEHAADAGGGTAARGQN